MYVCVRVCRFTCVSYVRRVCRVGQRLRREREKLTALSAQVQSDLAKAMRSVTGGRHPPSEMLACCACSMLSVHARVRHACIEYVCLCACVLVCACP
jgi:hypothetical protein